MEKKAPLKFEELRVLGAVETISDDVWQSILGWDPFPREVVGGQFAQAADSIGANIAESYGRFHYGEKLQFLYYARGSLFETKYWLNRAHARGLIPSDQVEEFASQLSVIARQINAFASRLKSQRRERGAQTNTVRESQEEYETFYDQTQTLFSDDDLLWLRELPNT